MRNDIYALGLVLRYLIGNAAAPAHIQAAIERCVETLPEKRFGSVAEFRDALQGPVAVRRPAPQLRGFLVASLLLVLSASLLLWQSSHAEESRAQGAPSAPSARPEPRKPSVANYIRPGTRSS